VSLPSSPVSPLFNINQRNHWAREFVGNPVDKGKKVNRVWKFFLMFEWFYGILSACLTVIKEPLSRAVYSISSRFSVTRWVTQVWDLKCESDAIGRLGLKCDEFLFIALQTLTDKCQFNNVLDNMVQFV
jgi:hypothetical protein